MNKQRVTLLLCGAFVVLIVGAVVLYNSISARLAPELSLMGKEGSSAVSESEAAGSAAESEIEKIEAPDFTVQNEQGEQVKLSDLRGKPVVLNFWASWCPPCKREMPDFEKMYAEMGDEVAFMMVNMTDGSRETEKIAAAFIAESGHTFPVYYDLNQEAAYNYGVSSLPTTYFIDSDGFVVTGAQGQINEAVLRKGIDWIHPE